MLEREAIGAAARAAEKVGTSSPTVDDETGRVVVPVGGDGSSQALTEIIRALDTERVQIADLHLRRPTMDDVFLALTGHAAEDTVSGDGEVEMAGGRGTR